MTGPTPSSIAVDLVALKVLGTVVREGTIDRKIHADEVMAKGDNIAARATIDGQDIKLGRVGKSDPKPVARIIDHAAFDRWLAEHVPDCVDQHPEFGPAEEVAAVLNEHAPHLLSFPGSVADWARSAELRNAEAAAKRGETPAADGVEVTIPDGVVSVRETPEARAAVLTLIRQGVINVETPLAITGGAA